MRSKLSDTQLVLLTAAAKRDERRIILPERLRGGAADKVLTALRAKGLIEPAPGGRGSGRANAADIGGSTNLRITGAGLKAIGMEAEPASSVAAAVETAIHGNARPRRAVDSSKCKTGRTAQVVADAAANAAGHGPPSILPRSGSKLHRLIALLGRPEGVSIGEASAALDWMAHSIRGAVSGSLKKKHRLNITSGKIAGRGTVYRIAD